MKVKDILKDADSWVQGDLAIDRWGSACSVYDGEAAKWCLLGALIRVYRGRALAGPLNRVVNVLNTLYDHGNIVQWNDDPLRTFEDVRRVIEIADV